MQVSFQSCRMSRTHQWNANTMQTAEFSHPATYNAVIFMHLVCWIVGDTRINYWEFCTSVFVCYRNSDEMFSVFRKLLNVISPVDIDADIANLFCEMLIHVLVNIIFNWLSVLSNYRTFGDNWSLLDGMAVAHLTVSEHLKELKALVSIKLCAHITHIHAHLTALFPGLPRWAGTRKVKPIWILLKQETVSGSGISWAICSRQITMPEPHHSVFFTGRMPFLPPNQQRQSTEGTYNMQ